MSTHTDNIKNAIEPLRTEILNHKAYSAIKSIEDLKVFMQYHVFAVWDFMSLLKALQNELTCVSTPWFPKGTGDIRFLINEIVVGEESDVDPNGVRKSHFELYLDAMNQVGADTGPIETFIKAVQETGDLHTAYNMAQVPMAARLFVDYTFSIINSNKAYLQSAIFTFGREDLIPGMFMSIINDINKSFPEKISIFKYYLDRHIEIDGDHHSHLALQMTANLCGIDEERWAEAAQASMASLQQRIQLWDGVYAELTAREV